MNMPIIGWMSAKSLAECSSDVKTYFMVNNNLMKLQWLNGTWTHFNSPMKAIEGINLHAQQSGISDAAFGGA